MRKAGPQLELEFWTLLSTTDRKWHQNPARTWRLLPSQLIWAWVYWCYLRLGSGKPEKTNEGRDRRPFGPAEQQNRREQASLTSPWPAPLSAQTVSAERQMRYSSVTPPTPRTRDVWFFYTTTVLTVIKPHSQWKADVLWCRACGIYNIFTYTLRTDTYTFSRLQW